MRKDSRNYRLIKLIYFTGTYVHIKNNVMIIRNQHELKTI